MINSEFLKNRNHVININIKTLTSETAEFIKFTFFLTISDKNKLKSIKEILSSFLKICEHFKFKIIINLNSETQAKQHADKAFAIENDLKENLFILDFTKNSNLCLNSLICS